MSALTTFQIARVCYEAVRAYAVAIGEWPLPFEDAAPWQVQSVVAGVVAILDGRVTRPEQSHESWCAEKLDNGWRYGPTKNAETKEHPCLVPYEYLPAEQQRKDALFFAIVNVLRGHP